MTMAKTTETSPEKGFRIEALLSARLFLSPQLVGKRIYFISDLSGRLSLYAMDKGGSVPEPLLPRDVALHTPALLFGKPFYVFPKLGKIVVMIDRDGDENYQPYLVPMEGGFPEPLFGREFEGQQLRLLRCDPDRNIAYFSLDPRTDPNHLTFRCDLETRRREELGTSPYGNLVDGVSEDHTRLVLVDSYTAGDHVLYLWEEGSRRRELLFGTPLDARREGEEVPLNSIHACHFTPGGGLLFVTSLFEDTYGLGYFPLENPQDVRPVRVEGALHRGLGELTGLEHINDQRYLVFYNIDGCSYVYEGTFDEEALRLNIERPICGVEAPLKDGVLQSLHHDKDSGHYALAFSTATSPAQIYTVEDGTVKQHTRERVLGIPQTLLAPGEDASYTSHDGLRISARLYLPSPELGYKGPRPVVFYIHGGPHSQERPDFTWFSMPLIQYFTLRGFAVFVPNVRGSSGYGLSYMKQVDRDWGGKDRLDHVAAFEHLKQDPRLDMERVGVMGRSYGGYMTLMLAGRHPELWKAACDMFGPYNLLTFLERIPPTWQTYFRMILGDPERDREFLIERSPKTHLHNLKCPLLVIQGRNDPRVVEAESRDLVEELRRQGKQVEYLVFEDEGHDVTKFPNKVKCYNEIVRFFTEHLAP